MTEYDLILDGSQTPGFMEISGYISGPAALLWRDFNTFVTETYKSSPKIAFSKCSGKPGWNVKYQKSGKSLCTMYPEKDSFVVLVVITLDMLPMVEAISQELSPSVKEIIKEAKPFNGTKWLMVAVNDESALSSVKRLMLLKSSFKRP